MSSRSGLVATILLFFAAAALLSWHFNAFGAEFGDNADEAAHYVTGLMVRDYAAQGFPAHAMDFARNYYLHYPKVALGHWPPFFYVLQAIWTLLFGPSRIAVMLLMAAITGTLAALLYESLRREFSRSVAIAAALLWLTLPVVGRFSRAMMAEMLIALLLFLATLAYGRYLDTLRWQPAAWFGLWFALALLTKGTGVQLALVPPLAVLLTRRWQLLVRFSFWLPMMIAGALAAPWYLLVPGAQHESVSRFGGVSFQVARLLGSFTAWAEMAGIVLTLSACIGLWIVFRGARIEGKWIAGICVMLGAYVARVIIGAFEDRHLMGNLPVLLMFAAATGFWLSKRPEKWVAPLTLTAVICLAGFHLWETSSKRHFGYSEVAGNLLSRPEFKTSVILACGDGEGEGMLISEIAMRERPRPGHIILRGNKMLASSDWMMWNYQPLFQNKDAMLSYLESIPAGIVVFNGTALQLPHCQMLSDGLKSHPETWEYLQSASVLDVHVYRLIGHEGKPASKIRIPTNSGVITND